MRKTEKELVRKRERERKKESKKDEQVGQKTITRYFRGHSN